MKKGLLTIVTVAAVSTSAFAQVQLNLASTVDLIPYYSQTPGYSPSAVVWNGTDAYLGSYNNSGAAGNTSIVRLSNALTTPTFGTAFGGISTPNSRGITGLALQGTNLAVSLDIGAASGDSVRLFSVADPANPTLTWSVGDPTATPSASVRGNGVAFDPGFGGLGKGVSSQSIGRGFAFVYNVSNGASAYNINVNSTAGNTTWRDSIFDTNGDFYARESNRVIKGVRTGVSQVNSGNPTTIIYTPSVAANTIDNQNIGLINSLGGSFLVFNDRSVSTGGQLFSDVVKVTDTSGNVQTVSYGGGFNASTTGNGAYDFSYDSGSKTLAVSDFSNQRLYIFNVLIGGAATPEPGSIAFALFGGGVGMMGLRRRKRRL